MRFLRTALGVFLIGLRLVTQGADDDFLERRGPSVPKLVAIKNTVDEAGRIAQAGAGDGAVFRETQSRIVTSGAGESVVAGHELAGEENLSAKLPFAEGRWVWGRNVRRRIGQAERNLDLNHRRVIAQGHGGEYSERRLI